MKFTSIRIEGPILSGDILEKIEQGEIHGQKPADFGFETTVKVKDEIATAWADARNYWESYKRRTENLEDKQSGTSETRKFWMLPFWGLLGYEVERSKARIINEKTYAVSHKDSSIDDFPIHIMGLRDSLDKRRTDGGPRMSPHALLQEYLNLTGRHLYGIVTNGLQVRLLRDNSRLIKQSYLEFDLERMMEEELFADFAVMYRLLHVSRMPKDEDQASGRIIEQYHQDALESGSRIRAGLSEAVEEAILMLGSGFLQHIDNIELKEAYLNGKLNPKEYYLNLLRLIYRILFLLVIEERRLVYPKGTKKHLMDIYYNYYSVDHLRKLAENQWLSGKKHTDYWQALKSTFRLYENEQYGKPLEIKPLAGDLFGSHGIGLLNNCEIDNEILASSLYKLSVFTNKNTGQKMRVNYAALNVEEFGSVYEGLLEYDPVIKNNHGVLSFDLVPGDERSKSSSHYTPDELVQPLIKHSLDYIIEDKLKEVDKEKALLSITVCDVACGSGHILLNAARRIGTQLAIIREKVDQPSPSGLRTAVRDVIQNCIYGVDLNPLAVQLCKVALWLEAHNPNEPLNFLDHRIKCGNAIVGLAHFEELENGIATEAFKTLPKDDKDIAAAYRKRNEQERKTSQLELGDLSLGKDDLKSVQKEYCQVLELPEQEPKEIETKQRAYAKMLSGPQWLRLKQLADMQVAQFFIPKTNATKDQLTTQARYRQYLKTNSQISGLAPAIAQKKRFFHWFLEFPEVMTQNGFDCILGNPPFLGGKKISGIYGEDFLNFLKTYYAPASGGLDLVTYFFRRDFDLIKNGGFQSLISTTTIAQGDSRVGGLAEIMKREGIINHAVRAMKWPGRAAVEISLVTIMKGSWNKGLMLNGHSVLSISSYLDSEQNLGEPEVLISNKNQSFQGNVVHGKGFVLNSIQAHNILSSNPKYGEVLKPYFKGSDANDNISHVPPDWIINFSDKTLHEAKNYGECFELVEKLVKPERQKVKRKAYREKWWQHAEKAINLYLRIASQKTIIVRTQASKHNVFILVPNEYTYDQKVIVFSNASYDSFLLLNSSIHEVWFWRYKSDLGETPNYSPSSIYQKFPFVKPSENINEFGDKLVNTRNTIQFSISLGLTKTYNQFHNQELISQVEDIPIKEFQKKYGKETWNLYRHLEIEKKGNIKYKEAVPKIKELRQLHVGIDEAVLAAYGWHADSDKWGPAIKLKHAFYEVDYLPENDRVRYTIHPEARKEVLKRLLLLNNERFEEEARKGLHKAKDVKAYYEQKGKEVPEEVLIHYTKKRATAKPKKETKSLFEVTTPLFSQVAEEPGSYQANELKIIEIGTKVLAVSEEEHKTFMFHIVAANAKGTTEGFQQINADSNFAKLLLGKKEGDYVRIGNVKYEIQGVG